MEDEREMQQWLEREIARLAPLAIGGLDAAAAKELQQVANIACVRAQHFAGDIAK